MKPSNPKQKLTDIEKEQYRNDLIAIQKDLEATNRRQALFIKVLQILQLEEDVPTAMNMALAEIGRYTGVDRLATWENHLDGVTYGCTNEWCNDGIEPAIDYLRSMTIEAGKPWFDMLEKNGIICTSDIYSLDPFITQMLEKQGVKAIAVFPLSELDIHFGFLSFNFCWDKQWDEKDVELMSQISQIVSTATKRWQLETSRRQVQLELIQAKEKAEESDRLKTAFLANISHEIRTPLNAIVGFSSILAEAEDQEERRSYLPIVQENNDILLNLISDILDISNIEAGTMEFTIVSVDIYQLCKEVINTFSHKDHNETVELRFDENSPQVIMNADKNRIMQVISNFITNALKFTDKGSIILSYTREDDDRVCFSVTDTGKGIAADKLDEVFKRFVKLDSFAQGTGLGLSISKNLVELMGGEIGVESREGEGSRFWFTLPSLIKSIK